MKLKKLFIKQISFICFFILTAFGALAQGTITGVVSDEDSQPLPGVNIIVKGTSNGVSTNFDGEYSISNVASTDVLVFSYLGYKTAEVTVGNQTNINLTLNVDSEQLDDVVVIGYGSSSKQDLTSAVTSVSAKDFEKQPLIRAEDALQGRAAGVQVLKNSGAPGADIKVRVRGLTSINGNNDPLLVVDGIIGGNLASINTDDIKTFDILKDASATAIYGSRAANGVILITTKQGQEGPAKININYFTSFSTVPNKINLITPQQFADYVNEGISDPADFISVTGNGVDYQDIFFQTAMLNNLQVSASGKKGDISYFISGNYVDQEGIVFNTDYNRLSLRSNLKANLTDKFTVGLNLFASREKAFNLMSGGTSTDQRGGVTGILNFDPTLPLRDVDGNFTKSSIYGSGLVNPYAVQFERYGDLIDNRFNANLNLSYDINDKLNFTILAGAAVSNRANEVYQGIPAGTNDQEPPSAFFSSNNFGSYQLSNILSWSKEFDKNTFKLTGVYEIQGQENRARGFGAAQYSIAGIQDGFNFLELANALSVNANYTPSTLQSYLGRVQYDFDKRFYVTGAVRIDETSRFRSGNRTGVFPSGSVAYKLKPNSNTKIRLGYGETGNQDIAPFSTYQRFLTGFNAPLSGTSLATGIALSGPVDENLTWETTKQINVGVDFGLLNDKINVSLDWYQKNTTDLLVLLPQPLALGGGTLLTNSGEIKNSGIDVSISSAILDKGDFKWNANFNFSYVKNEVVNLGGLENVFQTTAPFGNATNAFIIEEGQPVGNFYGATFLGAWQTGEDPNQVAGSAKYALDSDGNVTQGVIGNGIPTTTWGLNQTFAYKNFDLNVLLRGVHDFDVLNVTRAAISLEGSSTNVPTSVEFLNRWTPQNQTNIPASGTNIFNSTRYVEDGSFIRLSNITLGYNLEGVANVFDSVRLYLSAQNLFTITDYSGYDPEVSSTVGPTSGSGNSDTRPSVDQGGYPNPRTFTFGLNLVF
ncbi:TonB-dependent receptor [Gaetbulibacter aquiaggeris]|uniref:TonB-dependent receptor n=1 Tax=Gaetbulibacter aquiaggeris TaxID=1735373 RepID=A0ABW7ML04_9FLAO